MSGRAKPAPTPDKAVSGRAVLARYERTWLRADVVAGLTVAAYLVPQVMAYAQLAGLDPVVGLWSAIVPAIVYALVGTSRHVSVGPESTTAIMIVVAVAPLAGGDPVRYATLTAALALLVGAILVVGGALRLGFLGDLLSQPILVGYMTGVAVLMVVSQLGRVTGVPIPDGGVIAQVGGLTSDIAAIHWPTFLLATSVVAFLLIARRFAPGVPGPLVAVIGATALVAALALDQVGVELVGQVPSGLPPLGTPAIALADLPLLSASAIGIALVAYTDVILTARAFATRNGYPIDANREMLAIGGANLAAGVTGGMPVEQLRISNRDRRERRRPQPARGHPGGSIRRRRAAPARRRACAVPVGCAWWTGHLCRDTIDRCRCVPAALALPTQRVRTSHRDRGERPGLRCPGRNHGRHLPVGHRSVREGSAATGSHPWSGARRGGVAQHRGLPRCRDDPGPGGLPLRRATLFANANDFKIRALEAVDSQAAPVEWLLLNAEAIVDIDLTAADALGELHDELERRGIVLAPARTKQDLRDQLERIGLITHIGPELLFPTLPVALEAFEHRRDEGEKRADGGAR